MPNHISQRIAHLRDLIQGGLYQDNLDRLARECGSLTKDGVHQLALFTLANVFAEISSALDAGAVEVSEFEILIKDVGPRADAILGKIAERLPITAEELEALVRTHLENRAQFDN